MAQPNSMDGEQLDSLLAGVVRGHQEKVICWIQGEPGAWGFLAGQAVTAARLHLGRSLTEPERRLVWHRLWWFLGEGKASAFDG